MIQCEISSSTADEVIQGEMMSKGEMMSSSSADEVIRAEMLSSSTVIVDSIKRTRHGDQGSRQAHGILRDGT